MLNLHSNPLASRPIRYALTFLLGLTARDVNARPRPIRASGTKNVDGLTTIHIASDAVESDIGDGDTVGGRSGRAAVLVVLLHHDAVLSDAVKVQISVGDVVDAACGVVDGLDA